MLAFLHLAQTLNLITVKCSFFKIKRCRALLHAFDQTFNDFCAFSFQEQHRIVHIMMILGVVDHFRTRRTTAFNLVLQTRSASIVKKTVFTLA